ncbi:Acetyl-/propionyl-coenzyme A carboxylase alpha chain [Neolewinella maritima]|uniref:Acetyl-/propionyl-coenzyme A carboxylase alpha chain n=1 Tax=Neolewinella maritima TaxID=1383882 RepID=A0ABM9B064_9BACT|nr:acetyl-CoA carboxylase biotin carboxylase subunit [Neolewinella maritima]CAH1000341.1 Acetyl-/propionyl-coenzyme A carboxylase alpha chain [Neolewinella maritima]
MKKLLVANRGEIALRIMRTARRMGIATVAVYSEADRGAPHVRFADESVLLGPAPSAQSYLRIDKVIEAARSTGADALHPGYGFLSENAEFARQVAAADITFVGPRPHAIEVMGNKLAAKAAVADYDIPMVPGFDEAVRDVARATEIADQIGYPILIKAAAGGGGKGMRIVNAAGELSEQMQRAISEAESAFGDGAVFIEKYVAAPHHIEIQVLADTHGNCLHLFERDCSIQRRHQKVIEEAPSAILSPALRRRMGEAAVQVARACDYVGAGTVEFLVDEERNFYFLEMNTRLQVEHPVTELITGIDLVEQQLRVARGEQLAFTQDELTIDGHALELRVYAEDPSNDFLPSIGTLTTYQPPEAADARVDDGFTEGMEIPIYYDPMIAKLITHGATRAEAIERMLHAINTYRIEGIETTLPFGRFVCQHPAFRSGDFSTNFVARHFTPDAVAEQDQQVSEVAALFAALVFERDQQSLSYPTPSAAWRNRRS